MTTPHVRAFLAILVVGVFIGLTATMALFPMLSKQQVELSQYADFFTKIASVYSGIVGVIIGYYFARTGDKKPDGDPGPQERTSTDPGPRTPA